MDGSGKDLPFGRAVPQAVYSHHKHAPSLSIEGSTLRIFSHDYVIILNRRGQVQTPRGKSRAAVFGMGFLVSSGFGQLLVFQPVVLIVERWKVGEELPGFEALILLKRAWQAAGDGNLSNLPVRTCNILDHVSAGRLHWQQC